MVQLFNEGNTVPFITRYRKEKTGGLDEDAIRQIQARLNFVKQLNERKQTILRSIETQGKLTEELRREIENAPTVRALEDLYLPFKPKKKSLATAAREKGLEPLALAIWHSDPAADRLDEVLPGVLVNPEKQLNTAEEAKAGVQHILAEMIAETAEIRSLLLRKGAVANGPGRIEQKRIRPRKGSAVSSSPISSSRKRRRTFAHTVFWRSIAGRRKMS